MSTNIKKKVAPGVRYTPAQKKEVVDFVVSHNTAKGRGGQTMAVSKFKISPITIGAWLKAAGIGKAPKAAKAPKTAKKTKVAKVAKAPKVAKAAKAAKAPKVAKASKSARPRYTAEQKKEVTDFVKAYNAANGRGGQSKAAEKYKISPLTVMAWLKSAGVKKATKKLVKKAGKSGAVGRPRKVAAPAASGGLNEKLSALMSLNSQIAKAEVELALLKAKFSSVKASL